MSHVATWPDGTRCAAIFSDDQRHRYVLTRTFAGAPDAPRIALFLMLNPSTATHEVNDPTITRCVNFAKAWGYEALHVANLFSLRATNPRELYGDLAAEGDPCNLSSIGYLARHADIVVCAWGVHGALRGRDDVVIASLVNASVGQKLRCLGLTKDGHPKHPLYLAATTPLVPYQPLFAVREATHA